MPIRMVLEAGRSGEGYQFCPQFFCDQCGERIMREGNALYLVGADGPVTGEIYHVHKRCNGVFEHLHPPGDDCAWYWEELRRLPAQLGVNLGRR